MSNKRRDHKGKVLKEGESQRKDLMYRYRYTDLNGKRVTIYSKDLKELREKEKKVQLNLLSGITTCNKTMTVEELVRSYVDSRFAIRETTKDNYDYVIRVIQRSPFGRLQIGNVRRAEAKAWLLWLKEEGYVATTIRTFRGIVRAAFQSAYEDEIIRRNPFDFELSTVIPNQKTVRVALSRDEQRRWLMFVGTDPVYNKFIDMYIVLLGTGLRVGELCGLTFSDVDFDSRRIKVDHQIVKTKGRRIGIGETKTEKGVRYIPMSPAVYRSLANKAEWHRKYMRSDYTLDGYSGFIFCNSKGVPLAGDYIARITRQILNKYRETYPDLDMPRVTPHVFRHTFCTEMAMAGMNVKNLQYLMGHSTTAITMDVYTHMSYDSAEVDMLNVLQIQG